MTKDEILKKTQYGDYETLGKMLQCSSPAARSRFMRGDEDATDAMARIIESREKLINEFINGAFSA